MYPTCVSSKLCEFITKIVHFLESSKGDHRSMVEWNENYTIFRKVVNRTTDYELWIDWPIQPFREVIRTCYGRFQTDKAKSHPSIYQGNDPGGSAGLKTLICQGVASSCLESLYVLSLYDELSTALDGVGKLRLMSACNGFSFVSPWPGWRYIRPGGHFSPKWDCLTLVLPCTR